MHFKIVVEGLINGFDVWLDGVADDISYPLGPDRTEKKKQRHQYLLGTDIAASLDSLIGLTVAT